MISFRDMTYEDISKVYEIECNSFATPWSKQSLTKELDENKLATYVVMTEDENIIGYYGLWIVASEAHIMTLAVDKQSRSKGMGSLLMEHLIEDIKEKGVFRATLEVRTNNLPALKLYEKFSFKISALRKNYYRDTGDDAYIMWLDMGE